MHPTTIEFLARDRIADLQRRQAQPHVPETTPRPGPAPAGRRARIGVTIAAIGRRVHRPRASAVG